MAPHLEKTDQKLVLFGARMQDHPDGKAVLTIAAQPLEQFKAQGTGFDLDLPWPQARTTLSPPIHTPQILEQESAAAAELARLSELIQNSLLISFDASALRDTYLLPLFASHNAEPPAFSSLCIRDLALRLLDPETEACRSLEALSADFGLASPEQENPRAEVLTLARLLDEVLQPRLVERQLTNWEQITVFAASPWFPSRFAFGKYKGRHVLEAAEDPELKAWLERLSQSSNSRSASMARWYLDQLDASAQPEVGLVPYSSPEVDELQARITASREQLAELEAEYTEEHQAVAVVQSQLFLLLRPSYEIRDLLQLRIDYRRRFLDALLREGEEQAAKVAEEHQQASQENQQAYEEASREASDTPSLNPEEQQELRSIYRRLAVLFHPDRFAQDPPRQAVYETLMKLINSARDSGWIARLREIAVDPNGFLLSQGLTVLDLDEDSELDKLQKLHAKLMDKIEEVRHSLVELRQSSDYELWQLSLKDPGFINSLAADEIKDLLEEITRLEVEAAELAVEIEDLTGSADPFEVQVATSE
jgi:DNA polymerase-3 subunit epsilon